MSIKIKNVLHHDKWHFYLSFKIPNWYVVLNFKFLKWYDACIYKSIKRTKTIILIVVKHF